KKLTGRKWWERGGGRVPPGRIQSLPPILPPSTKRENSTGITPPTLPPKWERQTGRRRERNDGRPSPRLPILPPLRLPLLPLPLRGGGPGDHGAGGPAGRSPASGRDDGSQRVGVSESIGGTSERSLMAPFFVPVAGLS